MRNFSYIKLFLYEIIGISIIVLLIICQSCKKPNVDHYYLGSLKNQIPFKGFEKLFYLKNDGDTIVLYGRGRYVETEKIFYSVNSDDYYTSEKERISFISYDSLYHLNYYLQAFPSTCILSIWFKADSTVSDSIPFGCNFNDLPLRENHLEIYQYYLPCASVLNNNYNNVFVDTSSIEKVSVHYNMKTMYETNHGAIEIGDSLHLSIKLIRIEW